MKKNITKQQIIDTALALMENRYDIRSINMREIARELGCAHTNLYNYFPAFHDLLWEAHMEIQNRFVARIGERLAQVEDSKKKLYQFFFSLSELYIDHKGWFRLAWVDYIDDRQPEEDKAATEKVVETMVEMLETIWLTIHPHAPSQERIHRVLHDVHCYVIGEVSNDMNGRGVIQNSDELKQHIAETAVSFFTLSLGGTVHAEL